METLTEVATFRLKTLAVTDQHLQGHGAYGLRHMTAVAAQPRLKAYSLKTSQVHLAPKPVMAKNTFKFNAIHPPIEMGGLLADF